jgi:hypothetical protein
MFTGRLRAEIPPALVSQFESKAYKNRCLIGVTRPTLFTLPTLHIFINFSKKKKKKPLKILKNWLFFCVEKKHSFTVTHV